MTLLILGLVIFLGIHSLSIVAEPWRNSMATKLGNGPWQGVYTLVSVAGFLLMIYGYGEARANPVVLYTPAMWMRYLGMGLMVFFFPMFLATYLPGRIKTALKHPTLVATKTWALAHLLMNGMLHDVVLFGALLAWAVADRISLKRRTPRPLPGAPESGANDVIAVVAGLAFYALFVFWLHGWLFGVGVM